MLPDRIVIATHNRKKAGEMTTILSESFPQVRWESLADFVGAPEPEETGADYAENASIKAASACAFTGAWALADDAGLEIDALEGAPGLYSKRFGGKSLSFPEKVARILDLMDGVPPKRRTARFRCAVALARPGEPLETFEAIREGYIAQTPDGAGGFGYDPIFFLPELGCTMAQLPAAEKHKISHRGRVLALVTSRLRELAQGWNTVPAAPPSSRALHRACANWPKAEYNSRNVGPFRRLALATLNSMASFGRFSVSLALLLVVPAGLLRGAVARSARLDPTLQVVTFRGIQTPDGKQLGDDSQIECKVYDPKKPESTQAIAHAIGTAGATEFDVPILNNEYTHDTLNGCRCSVEIHGKGAGAWDVTPYLVFKFFNGSTANVGFGKLKLGSGDGYKARYDVMIDGL